VVEISTIKAVKKNSTRTTNKGRATTRVRKTKEATRIYKSPAIVVTEIETIVAADSKTTKIIETSKIRGEGTIIDKTTAETCTTIKTQTRREISSMDNIRTEGKATTSSQIKAGSKTTTITTKEGTITTPIIKIEEIIKNEIIKTILTTMEDRRVAIRIIM